MKDRRAQVERLELDVDTRLLDVWATLDGLRDEDITLELAAKLMRAAYARGYADALGEDVWARLYVDNGYALPTRRGGEAHELGP